MSPLPERSLGRSGLDVSVMSLGSWRTFERITPERGLAIMEAARTAGITFLDDARYDDETGNAPLRTGYSEVVFGQLFRQASWVRDEVVVANKLWWEHWPGEDAAAELDGSLGRMGFDHVDLIYAMPPPDGLAMETVVEQVGGLLTSGRARAWGTGMWTAAQLHEALDVCAATGVSPAVAAQMATSLVDHNGPDDPEMRRAFDRGPIGLVASYVLAGGTLTGKYLTANPVDSGEPTGSRNSADSTDAGGRVADEVSPLITRGKALAVEVVSIASSWAVPPAHVAFAYAFMHPNLASIVFGASTAEQLRSNIEAYRTFERLDTNQLETIAGLASN